MLKFRKAVKEEKEKISSLLRTTPEGAAAFSVLHTSPESICDSFLLGENENSEIESVVFDTGDEFFLVYGEEFPPLLTRCEKIMMIYSKSTCEKGRGENLQGKEILDLYKLMSEKNTLSFDDERRYVLRLRAVNSGYAAVFGIRENGRLVACASVSSMNEKYALIADVFTEKDCRSKGLARECLMSATDFALKNNRIPFLLCDENMCSYYEKAGFEIYGKM